MSAEGWATITFWVFVFWFVLGMFSGFYFGIAESWSRNVLQAFLAAVRNTFITAVVGAIVAALVTGVKELWL